MCNNGVDCIIDSGGGGDGNSGVNGIVAKGPQGILKGYLPLEWLNHPLLVGDGGGDGGGDGDGNGGGGVGGDRGGGGGGDVDV